MLYATHIFVPDAFLLLQQNGHATILLSDLEVDRGRKTATVDEVVSISEFSKEHKNILADSPPSSAWRRSSCKPAASPAPSCRRNSPWV